MKEKNRVRLFQIILLLTSVLLVSLAAGTAVAQANDPSPPGEPVKLIFIHHSCGENWLADDNGGLGQALMENNYFVSDTNYGWGPDSIGDRTDIVDWPDWFLGPNSGTYLTAVYNESEQNSWYTRLSDDPGGENTIIMFKSCFPNSNLEGSPNDGPTAGRDYNVGNAKYIYNDLLNYFRTQPDKLFIVVTAPPVSDSTYGANARAFNTWLVEDWLAENDYPLNNVAVFDFYNVLTGADNHHRFNNGSIEYINDRGRNTSHYPSGGGDDHPNSNGNRKATEEFVQLLNVYYNRWRADAPAAAPADTGDEQAQPQDAQPAAGMTAAGVIEDFEGSTPASSEGWQGYWDEAVATSMQCAPGNGAVHEGSNALQMDFNVLPESWATCVLFFDTPQNWSGADGISFYYQASQAQLVYDLIVYTAPAQDDESYEFVIETVPDSQNGWVRLDVPWENLLRSEWQANGGTPLSAPNQVSGFGFGFTTYTDAPNIGTIWVDDIQLLEGGAVSEQEEQPVEVEEEQPGEQVYYEEQETEEGRGPSFCGGSAALVMLFGVGALWLRQKPFFDKEK